jgi:hypothetical protein
MESWRKMDHEDQEEFLAWVHVGLKGRLMLGDERYNSFNLGFQGDPLQHAIEEWFDLGQYLFRERKRQHETA